VILSLVSNKTNKLVFRTKIIVIFRSYLPGYSYRNCDQVLLKIGLRSAIKYRNVSLIGILSLSIGISVLLLITIYTRNELSVDGFHSKAPQICKVSYGNSSSTPGPLSYLLSEKFPEIQKATHIETHQLFAFAPVLDYKGQPFQIEGYYSVDSSFFQLFDFEVVHGDMHSAVRAPFSIILTETEAKRIFNSQNPVGETVTWRIFRDFTFTVAAVVRDPPQNSSIRFNGLISETSLERMGMNYLNNWGFTVFETYLLLNPGVNSSELEQKLRAFLTGYYKLNLSTRACYADAETNPLELHELRQVYFNEDLANDTTNRGNMHGS
jgi:putative ABC transport system permease protein